MRCLTCNYDLSGLTEHRCPECGRAFDPKDASTFDTRWRHLKRVAFRHTVYVFGLCLGTYLTACMISFYLVRTDTTYVAHADSAPAEWDLTYLALTAMYRAIPLSVLLVPLAIVVYVLFIIMRSTNRPEAVPDL